MKHIITDITLMIIFMCVGTLAYAQKNEIKAFEKQNKEMLKQIKKQYKITPKVKLTKYGAFYIELKKKASKYGLEEFLLLDETGNQLYSDWIYSYSEISQYENCFWISQFNGKSIKWGVIDIKGTQIFPVIYDKLWSIPKNDAGTYKSKFLTHWRPANISCWVVCDTINHRNTFYSSDGKVKLHEYDGVLEKLYDYFWTIKPAEASLTGHNKGLLTLDGEIIFDQEYDRFLIGSDGFVHSVKDVDGMTLYGGKLINGELPGVVVPPTFCNLIYLTSENSIKCKMHRDDEFEIYDPQKQYEMTYKDKGERLYDMGKYQDVITFYEGEGYGTVWGDYYMGLAANEIASVEMSKMKNVINTLKDKNKYYLPIVKPDNYRFDAGTITSMYLSAGVYLEKYINSDKVAADDPSVVKAKKLRGEIVTNKNNVTKYIEEYGTALKNASIKNVEREQAIAVQKAKENAAAEQLATGLTNLLFGGSKKK